VKSEKMPRSKVGLAHGQSRCDVYRASGDAEMTGAFRHLS